MFKQSVEFVGEPIWTARYRFLRGSEIAMQHHAYRLLNGITGMTTNPSNTLVTEQGVDQNGSTRQFDYQSPRQIIIPFMFEYTPDIQHLSTVLLQNNYDLKIQFFVEDRVFTTYGGVVGNYEGGLLELETDNTFHVGTADDPERMNVVEDEVFIEAAKPILKHSVPLKVGEPWARGREANLTMLPMQLPQVLLRGNNKNIIPVTAHGHTHCKITISNSYDMQGIKIINKLSNTVLNLLHLHGKTWEIDSKEETLFIDGVDHSKEIKGFFIELYAGVNELEFMTPNPKDRSYVSIEYANLSMVVF